MSRTDLDPVHTRSQGTVSAKLFWIHLAVCTCDLNDYCLDVLELDTGDSGCRNAHPLSCVCDAGNDDLGSVHFGRRSAAGILSGRPIDFHETESPTGSFHPGWDEQDSLRIADPNCRLGTGIYCSEDCPSEHVLVVPSGSGSSGVDWCGDWFPYDSIRFAVLRREPTCFHGPWVWDVPDTDRLSASHNRMVLGHCSVESNDGSSNGNTGLVDIGTFHILDAISVDDNHCSNSSLFRHVGVSRCASTSRRTDGDVK